MRLKRLGVVLLFALGAAPAALGAAPTPQARQFALAVQPAMKLLVSKDGWYRATAVQLTKAGFAFPQNGASLQLFADGVQVPIKASARGIEFYGQALDMVSTDSHVYWLVRGTGSSLRVPVAHVGTTAAAPTGSFGSTVQDRERVNYIASVLNGPSENYFGPLLAPKSPLPIQLIASHVDPADAGSMRVAVAGLSLFDHTVKVELNGVVLGTATSKQQVESTTTLAVPAGTVKEGANSVTLTSVGGELDFSFIDRVELTYPHLYLADRDVLWLSVRPGQRVTVGGFSNARIRVFDLSSKNRARELAGRVSKTASGYSVSLNVPARTTRLLATTDAKVLVPKLEKNRPSSLNASGQGADLVMISYGDFASALKPLVALRQKQGYKVKVVDVKDVYDEFDFGTHGPQALTSFLAWAKDHWQPAPRYVLLFGDASTDPRDYRNKGSQDFVPSKFVDTAYTEAPSDDSLADFNGDGVPEMAVGRLPVDTVAEGSAVVSKIVNYAAAAGKSTRQVLLVSDKSIDYDFEAASRSLYGLIPPLYAVRSVGRKDGPTDAAVHSRVLSELNAGPTVVNFFGHGSIDIWTGGSILKTPDANSLTNSQSLSLYMMMTCLNGYFVNPGLDGLAEALLTAPNGGAVAAWASSGETVPSDQILADQKALGLILSDPSITLGQAMLEGKSTIHDVDVRRTWILLGDPTTTIH